MQYTPQELTDKLLEALDQDKNVVDMRAVLEVVSLLEDLPLTKEALGQTRIGKYVNEMRRKTNDKDLARRAKNLVRRWKQLVDGATLAGGTVNGEGIAARPGGGLPPHLPPHLATGTGSKPSSPVSRPATPSSGKSTQSPSLPSRSRPDTPSATSRPNTPSSLQRSPSLSAISSRLGTPTTAAGQDAPQVRAKPDVTPVHQVANNKLNSQPINSQGPSATSTPLQTPVPSKTGISGPQESVSETNAANRKRRRENDLNDAPTKRLQMSVDSPDGSGLKKGVPKNGLVPTLHSLAGSLESDPQSMCDRGASTPTGAGTNKLGPRPTGLTPGPSPMARIPGEKIIPGRSAALAIKVEVDRGRDRQPPKTPKVKTTAQLIQDMKASGDLHLGGSQVSSRIANNQIEKEADMHNVSIVPAGAKPRPRRKPGTVIPPTTSEKSLSETKTEMVEKFLQSSYDPIPSDQYEPLKFDPPSRTHSPHSFDQMDRSRDSLLHNNGSLNSTGSNDNEIDVVGPHTVTFFTDDDNVRHLGEGGEDKGQSSNLTVIDDPWSLLPPLLPLEEIDWTEPSYPEEPVERTVTETDVERLHNECWQGVNGNYDANNQWHKWDETVSTSSFKGDLLHILPYVNIDD